MSSFGRGLQLAGLAARGQAQNRLMGQQIASNQLAVEGAQDALDERYATREAMGAAANATAGAPVAPQAGVPPVQSQPWTFGGGAAPAAAGGTTPMATPAPARGMPGPTGSTPWSPGSGLPAWAQRTQQLPQSRPDPAAWTQNVPSRDPRAAIWNYGNVADRAKETYDSRRRAAFSGLPFLDQQRVQPQATPVPPGAYAGVGQSMPQQAPAPVGARPAAPQPMGGQPASMMPPQQPQQPGLGPMSGTLMSAPGVGGGAQLQAFDQQFAQLDAQMRALQPYAGRSSGAAAQYFQLAAQRNTMALQRSKILFDSAIASGDVGNAMAAFNQMTGANVQVADVGNGQYVLLSNGRPIENQAFDAPTLVSRLRIMSDTALQSEIQKQRFEYYKKLMEIQGNMQVQGMRNEGAANVANIQANTPKVLANNSMEGGFGVYRPAQDQFTFVPGTERGAPVQLPSGETVQTQSQPRTVNLAPPAAAGGMAPIGRDTNVYELLQP